jgi:oligoribonuclease NrnB/cAMP/cGMP phosphodiesterase (DHH superfamily)
MAAATVARFYAGERVIPTLAGNSDSDRVIQSLTLKAREGIDEIWITDLSWTAVETGAHLKSLLDRGAHVYWIDHHRTAVSRADAPEFKVPFTGKVLSEQYCAARLTFNYLKRSAPRILSASQREAFDAFFAFVELADDHDRWVHKIPESSDWALAVQTLGGMASYREIMKLEQPVMTRRLGLALAQGQEAMRKSVELARATMVDRELPNGIKVRTACCFGYSSEVASHLYEGQRRTVVALFDLRSQGISLRRSADSDVNLAAIAESFGGGGHAAASGFALAELRRLPAVRLAELLGAKLKSLPASSTSE